MLSDDDMLRRRIADNAYKMAQEHSLQKVGAKLKGYMRSCCQGEINENRPVY